MQIAHNQVDYNGSNDFIWGEFSLEWLNSLRTLLSIYKIKSIGQNS